MTIVEAVSDKLGRKMSERGWSIYKLSRLSGITPNGIQSILHKEYKDIKLSTIIILAYSLDMTISEFLSDNNFLYENLELYR